MQSAESLSVRSALRARLQGSWPKPPPRPLLKGAHVQGSAPCTAYTCSAPGVASFQTVPAPCWATPCPGASGLLTPREPGSGHGNASRGNLHLQPPTSAHSLALLYLRPRSWSSCSRHFPNSPKPHHWSHPFTHTLSALLPNDTTPIGPTARISLCNPVAGPAGGLVRPRVSGVPLAPLLFPTGRPGTPLPSGSGPSPAPL